jgi:hypothetical protein
MLPTMGVLFFEAHWVFLVAFVIGMFYYLVRNPDRDIDQDVVIDIERIPLLR